MANPFSGLENIGQSYLQGVQLANQRQAREEAAAQRAEDTRVRQQYYNQMGADREAALQERRQARMDQFASLFGRNLKLTPEGEVDIPASALARDRSIQEEQLAGAEGELGALYGTQAPLSPEVIGSPAFQTGKIRGTAKRLAQEKDLTAAMIRRGFIPADQEQDRELPDEVRNQIEDISAPDIFSGQAPMAVPAQGTPMGGGQRVSFGGRQYFAPTPTAKRAEKAGSMKYTLPGGEEVSIDLSPEAARELQAKRLASPDKEPDPFGDIDEAEKELKRLSSRGKDVDVNVYEDAEGNVKVRKDQFGFIGESYGYTIDEAKAQLEVRRKDREKALGITSSEPAPKNRANSPAASRARRIIPSSALRNVPPITQRVPGTASTNAPVVTAPRVAANSLQPAITNSSESLSELDPEELRQAMIEAQSRGVDPAVFGLQLRQALNQAGVRTAAGTNSLPLGLSQEQFDAILSLPRGRAPVEL